MLSSQILINPMKIMMDAEICVMIQMDQHQKTVMLMEMELMMIQMPVLISRKTRMESKILMVVQR